MKFGLISQADYDELSAAMAVRDLNRWAATAIPVCEDNVPLFAALFLKKDVAPHIWKEWKRIQKYRRILVRLPRGHSKTEAFTFAALVHRICYSVIPNSLHEDPRVLAIFETRRRANDRMLAVRQIFETGGPGGLIGKVFRGAQTFAGGEPTPWAGMTIPEIAMKFGEWNNLRVNLPHPRRLSKPDANVTSISPGEGSVGFHPRLVIADDIVGPQTAKSDAKRKSLSAWWNQAIEQVIKGFTTLWAPHTVFDPDDLNAELANNGMSYLMEMKALDRFPTPADFIEVRDDNGVIVDIKLTPEGETLRPIWGCPEFTEAECPFQEARHIDPSAGGVYHRPTKDLILQWRKNPWYFASQYMHVIRRSDATSIKPWMLRFYCDDPDCKERCLGKVSRWHAGWQDWIEEHPDAGLSKDPPVKARFTREGIKYSQEGQIIPIETSLQAWDLAFGKKRVNDRTVCARLYRFRDKHIAVIFEKGRWKHDEIWRKVVSFAVTDPIHRPTEVALEVDNEQIFPDEIRKLMAKMNVQDQFKLTEVYRSKEKDIVFHNSGLPIAMSNGIIWVSEHDEDAVMELLSVTPDQTGGHDDCADALTNGYGRMRAQSSIMPGFFGTPLQAH